MKKLIPLLMLTMLVFNQPSSAQDDTKLKLNSLSLSSGEGPLSNGLFFEAYFSRGNDILNVSLGERDMYFIYLKGLGSRFNIGPSFEFYYNLPLLGVMAVATPIKTADFSISTTTWTGISAGEFGSKADLANWQYLFF